MAAPKCPLCERFLRKERVAGVSILICPGGEGAWLTPHTMHTLSKEDLRGSPLDLDTGIERESNPHHSRRPCPACGTLMFEYHWNWGSHIYIDSCMTCRGVWVDTGELIMMQRYIKAMDKQLMQHPELAAKLKRARQGPPEKTPVEKVYDILDKSMWLLMRFLP